MPTTGQVLTDITHGGHVLQDDSPHAVELASTQESITLEAAAVATGEVTFETPFDYLFPTLTHDPNSHLPTSNPAQVVAALKALGDAMVEDPAASGDEGNSIIPPVYTYWGQFIDHDLTANTDRNSAVSDVTRTDLAPLDPGFVVENLLNLRQPTLNLDSLYGDGPTFKPHDPTQAGSFFDGIRFKIGTTATGSTIGGERIPPVDDLHRDLPRIDKAAQIADGRNDENLIVAQLHTAFLRFHNAAVDWIKENEPGHRQENVKLFNRAQQLTQWHYQWLVIHDYLKTVTLTGIPDKILLGGPKHYKLPRHGKPFMPLEFSVAGFRFGHTMVRAAYDHNRNFGRPGNVATRATLNQLFQFTGNGNPPFRGNTDTLPFNWIIEWDRFVNKASPFADHFTRKIDTILAPPLNNMVNQGNSETGEIRIILKSLARRNLLRGYLLSIPTGQSVAGVMGVAPLTPDELRQGNSAAMNSILNDNGFIDRTPMWYYVLKEAEVRGKGNSLGELGSRIVCETIIGQLINDPDSFLNEKPSWDPGNGVRLPNGDPIVTISDFIRFAGIPA